MANGEQNPFPQTLTVVKPRSVSELLTRSLRYLNQARGGVVRVSALMDILPYLRDAVELASNRKFLVPAPEFIKLATLDNQKRQFTWGIGAPDIDHPYPDTVHVLFLSRDDLQLYDGQGNRIAAPGATGGSTGGIWYFLEPMEGMELASSTNYESGGIPQRYWMQRTTPYHILYLDSEPYGSERVLYAIATFPLQLPEDDNAAINHQLRLQTGHYTYLWTKVALMASKEYGQADDVVANLAAINAEAMQGLETRNYDRETRGVDNWDIFDYADYEGAGGGPRSVAAGLNLRY